MLDLADSPLLHGLDGHVSRMLLLIGVAALQRLDVFFILPCSFRLWVGVDLCHLLKQNHQLFRTDDSVVYSGV